MPANNDSLEILLAIPTGEDGYDLERFVEAMRQWIFAFTRTPHGDHSLIEHGRFVERTTDADDYRAAWKNGVRAALKIMPRPPRSVNNKQILDPVVRLRQSTRRKDWREELYQEAGSIEAALLHHQPKGETEKSLRNWLATNRDITERADEIQADGCRYLLLLHCGDSEPEIFFLATEVGKHSASEVKEATEVLSRIDVDSVDHAESPSFDDAEKSKRLRDEAGNQGTTTPPRRKYVKKADAERIAGEEFNQLWRIDNKTEWARKIGCNRDIIGKLGTWQRAEKRRQGWTKIATRLKGVVDPAVIEALCTSDASALAKLSAEDRDKLDSMPDQERAELIEQLTDQARDAVS